MNEPVIVVGYPYSGVGKFSALLSARTEFAWLGIDLTRTCSELVAAWEHVEGAPHTLSVLARATIKRAIQVMVTTYLAQTGAAYWFMPAVADPVSIARFADLYPQAKFICTYRNPADFIKSVVSDNPRGLYGNPVGRFSAIHPGNTVAAAAEFWTYQASLELGCEKEYHDRAYRVRYEDLCADPVMVLDNVDALLQDNERVSGMMGLESADRRRPGKLSEIQPAFERITDPRSTAETEISASWIPRHLLDKIALVAAELDYEFAVHELTGYRSASVDVNWVHRRLERRPGGRD